MSGEVKLPVAPKRICPECGSRNTDCGRIYATHPRWEFQGAQAQCKDCGHKDEIRSDTRAWFDPAEYAQYERDCAQAFSDAASEGGQ
jgi:DNA-directed RNA polymerase subunit RPC12/RpoP